MSNWGTGSVRHYAISLAVAVVVALALIGVSRIGSSPSSATMIAPDQSIGPVGLGETRSQVSQVLGPGQVVNRTAPRTIGGMLSGGQRISAPGYVLVSYPDAGLQVRYVTSGPYAGRSIALITDDARYRTATGIGVGSQARQVDDTGICTPGSDEGMAARSAAWVTCTDENVLGPIGGGNEAATYFTTNGGRIVSVYIAGGPRDLVEVASASS